jgi:hypothetical protein
VSIARLNIKCISNERLTNQHGACVIDKEGTLLRHEGNIEAIISWSRTRSSALSCTTGHVTSGGLIRGKRISRGSVVSSVSDGDARKVNMIALRHAVCMLLWHEVFLSIWMHRGGLLEIRSSRGRLHAEIRIALVGRSRTRHVDII